MKRTLTALLGAAFICYAAAAAAATPTSMQESINATLRTHRGLKVIQENRDVVGHEVRRAKAGWGPSVDVTGGTGITQNSSSTTRGYGAGASSGYFSTGRIGVTLVQPLWDGLATRSRVRAAEATYDSMTSRVYDNATTLSLDAIIAHLDVLRNREIFRLSENNVKRHHEILASSQERQAVGADTMADVTQTQGRLARALSTLAESKASLRASEENYRRLTGGPVPADLEPIDMPPRMYDGVEPILDEAKKFNPKLIAYIDDIKAARGEQELTKASFHPIINLEIGPSYSDRGGKGSQWVNSMDFMATMRWNIFNSGADIAANKASIARVRQARQFMYNFVDDLVQQVEDTWISYISSSEQYQHYTDAISYNEKTRDAYLEQFMTGQRSLLDVLDAEGELFNSSTQAETARGNIKVSAYRMFALAGVLLSDLNISTAEVYDAPNDQAQPEGPEPFENRPDRRR